mmetsp:Transcript_1222/g.3823  ORF Transcript_1222/g.3823 Transcript_1222/m.3823 type:complete len:127 (+) Transcript_1222:158-538(+)
MRDGSRRCACTSPPRVMSARGHGVRVHGEGAHAQVASAAMSLAGAVEPAEAQDRMHGSPHPRLARAHGLSPKAGCRQGARGWGSRCATRLGVEGAVLVEEVDNVADSLVLHHYPCVVGVRASRVGA